MVGYRRFGEVGERFVGGVGRGLGWLRRLWNGERE